MENQKQNDESKTFTRNSPKTIPRSDLVVGGIYQVVARNFNVGVWNGTAFCGVTTEYGRHRITTEALWSEGWPTGTADALEALNDQSPINIFDGSDLIGLLLAVESALSRRSHEGACSLF